MNWPALVEKVAEDAAKSGGGEYGELVVEVYEAGKTGYGVGKVIGHTAFKTGFAAAELQNAAPQILGYILEKEMAYINKNTSDLFEYISLYDSGTLDRIDTYIFFYDAPDPERLMSKGVVLYYWAPTYKKWQKGENINTISDVCITSCENEASSAEKSSKENESVAPETKKIGCQDINLSADYSFYSYTPSEAKCGDFEKTFASSRASFKCKTTYGSSWRGYWVKEIDVSNMDKIRIKANLELNEQKKFFSECRGKEAGVKYDDYSALIVLSSDPRERFSRECNKISSEKLECDIRFSNAFASDKDPSVISY